MNKPEVFPGAFKYVKTELQNRSNYYICYLIEIIYIISRNSLCISVSLSLSGKNIKSYF